MTYGGIITRVMVPDREGTFANVVLGHDSAEKYFDNRAYLGAVVGRYANRIAGAAFDLDGATYRLAANNGRNHLHGGLHGFDRRDWSASTWTRGDAAGVTFERTSPDGEEGYPGTLTARVSYTLSAGGTVTMDYTALTDAPTLVNLTQHSYFNLSGDARSGIRDHYLSLDASRFTPVTADLIPERALVPVDATPFDFRRPARIGERLDQPHEQLRAAGGFDHNFALDDAGTPPRRAARLWHAASGRVLEIATTEPGVQFYDGHLLGGDASGWPPYAGLCLETQHFPDSPHHPAFPSTVLRPGEVYRSTTVWRFGIAREPHEA
jgi:aldose 1-epimerase